MSFGENLRRERELRGISLHEIAEATKISARFLQALEQDRLDVLPGGIFPRAFVKQYARYLGLDPEKVVAEFQYLHAEELPEKRPPPRPPRWSPPPGALFLGALAVAAVVLLLSYRRSGSEPPVRAGQAVPPSIPAVLGNFLIPLMIGARDLAFPRLNLASWYIYMIGAAFTIFVLVSGGVDTGWTFYTPYSTTYSNTHVVAAGLGVFITGFSSILTGLNFIVTIHRMRAPGLTWFRLPLFVWALYATSIIMLLGTPVLAITLAMVAVERVFRLGIFDPGLGGDPLASNSIQLQHTIIPLRDAAQIVRNDNRV